MQGRLRLVFRAREGKTYLAESYVQSPLKAVRPFELPDGRVVAQLLQVTPGIFGGDQYSLEIVVESGASVIVMSPSASKLHRMLGEDHASQRVDITVQDGGHLEYYPALNIPFPDADFRQHLVVDVARGGRFALIEGWAMGRVQRGEYLRFRRLSSRTAVDVAGRGIYRDALELAPDAGHVDKWGVLESSRYSVSGFWYGPEIDATPSESLTALAAFGRIEPGQYYFRGLFDDGVEMTRAVNQVVGEMCTLWGLPDPPLGSFSC